MSDSTDAMLKESISALENKREKYKRIKDSIEVNNLDTTQDLDYLKTYIEYCTSLIELIDGEKGYGYLSNFRDKLQEDVETLQEYYDYCTDANASFKSLHDSITSQLTILDTNLASQKNAYNKGKPMWEWIW